MAGKLFLLYDKKKFVPIPMVYCPEATLIPALVIKLWIFQVGMLPPMTKKQEKKLLLCSLDVRSHVGHIDTGRNTSKISGPSIQDKRINYVLWCLLKFKRLPS